MHELLTRLAHAGVRLAVVDDALQVRGHAQALTPDLRDALREHRPALLALLRQRADAPPAPPPAAVLQPAPADRHRPFPLTDVQHAYWLGRREEIELGGVSTHFYFEVDAQGLNLARFEAALQRLIERHDMLRAFIQADGQQRVLAEVPPYRVAVEDASADDEVQVQARLQATRQALSHAVHPADRWPLFDVRATRLPGGGLRLHFSLDMLLMDAGSMLTLFHEWRQLVEQPDAPLPPLALRFRDCVLAERRQADSAHAHHRRYWTARLDSLPAAPALPLRPHAGGPPRFSRRAGGLDRARWTRLKSTAREAGLTPSGLLLAAFAEVLTRWSTTPHYTLNLTLFNRPPWHPQVEAVVGDFTSLSLLEVDHREAGTHFAQRAAALQRQLMDDLDHRGFNGVQVLREWAQHHRRPALQALMPVVFTSALGLGGPDGEAGRDREALACFGPVVHAVSQTPQVWLDHQASEADGELVFHWDAVEALFEPGVLDAMFEAQCALLRRLADEEACWQLAAPLPAPTPLPAASTLPLPAPALLHAGVQAHAARTPHAPAVITPRRTLDYHALWTESLAVARWLQAQGLRPGELVGVLMHKGWEQAVALVGTLLAGSAYLPIDASLPPRRQHELLQIGRVRCVLVQPGGTAGAAATAQPQPRAVLAVAEGFDAAGLPPFQPAPVRPQDLAYVIFTSGTTGLPKGVMISHQAAWNTTAAVNALLALAPQDRILGVSSLGFDLSVYDLFGAFAAGAALVLPDARQQRDPLHWRSLIAEHRVSVWNSAPQLMRMLVESSGPTGDHAIATLRAVLLSGDWIPLDLPARVRSHCPAAQLHSLGGATEASIWSIAYPIGEVDPGWASIPYGTALPGQTVSVRDARLQPCPPQVRGRVYIGGAGLAEGYWDDAQRTASRFITHPETGERLYDTGDLGRYRPDGLIELLGRDDEQVKIRGHRVEPGEVAAVLRQHPEIRAAVVRAVGTPQDRQLAAYVQLADGPLPTLGRRLQADAQPDAPADASSSVAALPLAAAAVAPRPWTTELQALWDHLDAYHLAAVVHALRRFGFGRAGDVLTVPSLLARGVAGRYQRWLQRAFAALCGAGLLRADEPLYRVVHDWDEPDLPRLARETEERLCTTLGFSADEARWLTRTADSLHEVLTEHTHSAEIYVANATAGLYQRLFEDNHAQLVQVMQALAAQRPAGLSVLELGAGWGSATQHLLPVLRGQDRYLFTDISEYFIQRAQARFGDRHRGLRFARCDADLPPDAQGLDRHAFDVVLAVSMLHDVRDVRATLGHAATLLKPGGRLVLLEQTRFFRSMDLHMGLQQGFDAATDTDLRPRHALLSPGGWEQVLAQAGFATVQVLRTPGSVTDHLGFHVIVAAAPLHATTLDEPALRAYLRSRLPEALVPRHLVQLQRMPVTANGKLDLQALPPVSEADRHDAPPAAAPRTDTERLLLACWSAALPDRRLGIFDNFFDVGGDSLVATRVVREIGQRCACTVEIHELLAHPTVAALAPLVDVKRAAPVATETAVPAATSVFPALAEPPQRLTADVEQLAALLPPQEGPAAVPVALAQSRAVLLTGAAGWLGAYLLRELLVRSAADVVCPVRAPDAPGAMARIRDNLRHHGITLPPGWEQRVRAEAADLAQPHCGLGDEPWRAWCEGIDHIVHAAASIDTQADYAAMRGPNVLAVHHLLQLARQHHAKPIVFSSSHAVCLSRAEDGFRISVDESLRPPTALLNGYAQSKWVAEQLLARAGSDQLPIRVLRIPHVIPAGESTHVPRDALLHSTLATARATGGLPDWPDSRVDAVPVDLLAAVMVDLVGWTGGFALGTIALPAAPSLPQVIRWVLAGSGLAAAPTVALQHWFEQCRQAIRHGSVPPKAALLATRLLQDTDAGVVLQALCGDCAVDVQHLARHPAWQRLGAIDWQAYWTRYGSRAF